MFYGKYRAKVVETNDPEKRGRIRVMCPSVLHDCKSAWCEPCTPFGYDLGGFIAIPQVGETVWIEFEEGNANKPIYIGNWWSTCKTPLGTPYLKDKVVLKNGKSTLTLNKDTEMLLELGNAKVSMKDDVIKISLGTSDYIEIVKDNITIKSKVITHKEG